MSLTIEKLRIGSRLVMGKYGILNGDTPSPLVWLKGTPNCDFITEFAVDYLAFDAVERDNEESRNFRYHGNPKYSVSNLLQYLNSDQDNWFHKMHHFDEAPGNGATAYNGRYRDHYGFLYFFDEYEIESIENSAKEVNGDTVTSKVHLPSYGDFAGENRFKLFSKRGIRARGSEDFCCNRSSSGFEPTSYIPIWLADSDTSNWAKTLSRNGALDTEAPCNPCGVRPSCVINKDTEVYADDCGLYHIKPRTISTCTDEEIFNLLGIC